MQFGEFHREEDAFCLDRIACLGPLSISRLFRQLCQHQAHPVNHQPTKCRTADFYKRQSGTSWESGTFPIKFFSVSLYEYVLSRQLRVWEKPSTNKKQKKNLFRRSFLTDGQTTNPCHFQHDVSFVIRTFTGFNLFRSWLCFA